jgi:hypothetical protein
MCGWSGRRIGYHTAEEAEQKVPVIIWCGLVAPAMTAYRASLHDDYPIVVAHRGDRFHRTATRGRPITWKYINMPGPETPRAVVCIAGTSYLHSTVQADETLLHPRKSATHTDHRCPVVYCCIGKSQSSISGGAGGPFASHA